MHTDCFPLLLDAALYSPGQSNYELPTSVLPLGDLKHLFLKCHFLFWLLKKIIIAYNRLLVTIGRKTIFL